MSRVKMDPVPNHAVLSGSLGGELAKHAYERCRHFFLYLFDLKILVDYSNANLGTSFAYSDAYLYKASHQTDDGFRDSRSEYSDFDSSDAGVVDKMCTIFRSTDAAHFCNLGVKPAFMSRIATLGASDPTVADFYERLKQIMGNTRWLPQRVNIGPDRVIDQMHGRLGLPMLDHPSVKLISKTNIDEYFTEADSSMTVYRTGQSTKGNAGVAACADAYLGVYKSSDEQTRVFRDLYGAVAGDCKAFKLNSASFIE